MDLTTIGTLVAVFIGPLGAYFVAARKLSGKITTSEATELWNESRSIRDWSTERINTLNTLVSTLENRINECETSSRELRSTVLNLKGRVLSLTLELEASHKRIAELENAA